MDVEEAINRAKHYVRKVFAQEDASEIRLEEVEFEELNASWLVTISFVRPVPAQGFETIVRGLLTKRTYKTVSIADDGGGIPSIKIRQLHGDE